jgi:twinkle protein
VSAYLARDAERVARYLLGDAGKREGAELRYGDVGGAAGKSLGVHLTGAKAGVWCDFASGDSGDLLDLWAATRCSGETGEAIRQAKDWLGLRDVPLTGKRIDLKPIAKPAGIAGLSPASVYWLQRVRKLSPEAVKAYKVAEKGGAIALPSLLPSGELGGIKYRSISEDKYWREAGGAKCLFGWQAIPHDTRSVVLCEGELKALAWWDYGFPALSVPLGGGDGGKQDWIEGEYDNLARFDLILVAMDQDEAGRKAADEIVKRLGPERCAIVNLPLPAEPGAKCINACLRHDVSRAAIAEAVKAAKPRDPDELRAASDYADELVALFTDTGPEIGLRTPWKKVGDELVFRPGELTVIAGQNGHGKSQIVGYMLADMAARQGARCCVASLEFKVAAWLKRLVRQLVGYPNPAAPYVRTLLEWLGERLWAFDATGTASLPRMIEVFRYARRRYGVDLFVVDNLTGLGVGEEDMDGQKRVALSLAQFARDEGCHVWLVHHVRKGARETDIPDKTDIKGSGAITDLASTVLVVSRNKDKERKCAELLANESPITQELIDDPDVRLICQKQRNYAREGNGEPVIRLWWNGAGFAYLAAPHHKPRPMVML